MKVIGLTGGIGTGKSTVSEYMAQKGCLILDADKISRSMTDKSAPALKTIAEVFGSEFVDDEGCLNRKALGDLVFNDSEKLAQLQKIITEKVVEDIDLKIKDLKSKGFKGIIVVDAPLLFECGMESMHDENWLVVADLKSRIERVSKRDGLTEDQILARINNQMPQDEKEKLSQCIIDNSGTIDSLKEQIDFHLERIKNEF